ncbi:MAG: SUMF1/EgtB/PvdO family nonheme iron enzyme [Acidobacteriota bacterium]
MKQCEKCSRKFPDHMVFCPFDGDILDSEVEDPLLGRVLDGKYRLDEKLGEGGMGTVYRAKHVLIDNDLAVKVLHSSLVADRNAVARFQREAMAAARIKHPNAVGVTDFGITEDQVVYIVMELFVGQSLRDIIEQQGPMPLDRSLFIIRQVCLALDAAHRSGVIHRDIKPDNIVIENNGQGELVKVLDFGIAKLKGGPSSGRLTRQGVIIGSPHYLSPEQCQNSELDARSDIYSLGIVLYEMYTGDVPFKAPTPIAVAMMHTTDQPAPVREKRPDLPEPIERVVMRALDKLPANRQQSAIEMAQELERAYIESGLLGSLMGNATMPPPTGEHAFDYQAPLSTVRAAKTSSNAPLEIAAAATSSAANNGTSSAIVSEPLEVKTEKNAGSGGQRTPALIPDSGITSSTAVGQQSKDIPSFISNTPSNLSPSPSATPVLSNNSTNTLFTLGQTDPSTASSKRLIIIGGVIVLVIAISSGVYFSSSTTQSVSPPVNSSPLPTATTVDVDKMIYIPGGSFKMGNNQPGAHSPEYETKVNSFYIDETEVTNEEYKKFVDATKHTPPESWKNGEFPTGDNLKPVTMVNWDDANAYAKWAGKRLPTEAEWEYAARGTDRRNYPWGNDYNPQNSNSIDAKKESPEPVGSRTQGASPFGVLDMAGNVWEWTADTFSLYPGNKLEIESEYIKAKVIRGGSFKSEQGTLTTYTRNPVPASLKNEILGFRCAKSAQ